MANFNDKYRLNIFKFLHRQVTEWNDTGHCGAPIVLSMPLSVQKMNQYTVRWEDPDKVHMFLTRYNASTTNRRSVVTNFQTDTVTAHNFELYIVKPFDSTGTQVHNEVRDDYPNLIADPLSDLLECFGLEQPFPNCYTEDFEVTQWQAYPVIYAEDNNYTGWRIVGTFEQIITPNLVYDMMS